MRSHPQLPAASPSKQSELSFRRSSTSACLLIVASLTLPGCLSVCPDARDREAKAQLFSLEEPSVLELASSESIDAAQVAANAETRRRVLWMSAEETSARLGAFRSETEASFSWRRERDRVQLSEKAIVELSKSGDFRVKIDNDRDFGMELRWVGGASYVKSRQGTFRERRVDRAGHEEWREEALGQIQTLLELVDGKVQIARTGAGTHEGRPVIRYAMANASATDAALTPPPRPHWAQDPVYPSDGPDEALTHRLAPFERGRPERVTGELWIDQATATILHADIQATLLVPGGDEETQPARLELKVRRTLREIGQPRMIDVPEHRPFERRPRAIKDPLDWWPPYVAEKEAAEAEGEAP